MIFSVTCPINKILRCSKKQQREKVTRATKATSWEFSRFILDLVLHIDTVQCLMFYFFLNHSALFILPLILADYFVADDGIFIPKLIYI